MSLFKFPLIRKLIRKYTNPIPEDKASKWKRRLAVVYLVVAWNAFAIVCYQVYQGKADWPRYYGLKTQEEINATPAQQWSKTLGIKKAEVYKVSGFNVTHYRIDNEETSSTDK